jgi:zinc transport system substrate-binding protein
MRCLNFSKVIIFTCIFLFLFLMPIHAKNQIKIGSSILPISGLIEKIGGQYVDVYTLVESGADPHVYEPRPSQLRALAKLDAYFSVGSGIEFELLWLDKFKALNSNMRIINCTKGITLSENCGSCSHGHDHSHDHMAESFDPHVWVSINNLIMMVSTIRDALISLDPEHQNHFESQAADLMIDLYNSKLTIKKELAKTNQKAFLVLHSSWGYFSRDFGLEQIVVHMNGKEPSAKDMARIIQIAKQKNIQFIITSKQFSQKSARLISKEINGRIVQIDTLNPNITEALNQIAKELSL